MNQRIKAKAAQLLLPGQLGDLKVMDCAATLSGIKDTLDFDQNMNNFNEATAIRNKIRNVKKKEPEGK